MTVAAAIKNGPVTCRVQFKKVISSANLAAINETFSKLPNVSILGGNAAKTDADGFSYWAAQPKQIFEFGSDENNPFEKLQAALDSFKMEYPTPEDLPKGIFVGGWIGYFAYELGSFIEKLSSKMTDDMATPLIRLLFYDRLLCYDHKNNCFYLVALKIDNETENCEEKFAELENLLNEAEDLNMPEPESCNLETIDPTQIGCNMSVDYYYNTLKKIKKFIFDGDVYQINFSQRFECDYAKNPIQLYHWQNHYNPSGYAAYIDAGDFQIVSASPEMFITVQNNIISTKPIKGTRKRYGSIDNEKINAKNLKELTNSEKEKAELNMIIDLERNDLARICKPGTRQVIQNRTIEAYPTVFHAVATVAGELKDKISFSDILKAMFPGGSITGAPKVSAMEIINQLEPTTRGVYTGSIGFIGLDGTVCLNIAIRTIIIKDNKAYVQTGGGIVADSEAKAEWEETITKAAALLAAIKGLKG